MIFKNYWNRVFCAINNLIVPRRVFGVVKHSRVFTINTFDIDGVVSISDRVGGVHPGPYDIIITGRSYEEIPETRRMLSARGIYNRVFFNRTKFDEKTREGSGLHKAHTIQRLEKLGYAVMCHFEDDEIQARVIRENCPNVTVVMLVHDLTNKENVRHE